MLVVVFLVLARVVCKFIFLYFYFKLFILGGEGLSLGDVSTPP